MKETSYYELKMPDSNDTIDVSVLNNNMKRLDDVLILTVIGRTAETSEFVKKCCAPYIMIQNLGEETVTIYDRRWPEDMWEDNKIVIEPSKFYTYRVANSVNANFLVLDNKECNFRYFITAEQAIAEGGGGSGGGTTDYNELDNQPKVNGIVLVGNKSFKELGLLNDDGKIKSDYLPPFVDNMDSYDTKDDFPEQGEEDKLYLDKSTNLAYVWAGSDYACIGTPLALGITHETAGYGDESRAAYNHSLSEHARTDATKTEASSQNGYVKINGEETKVYEHPGTGTNPHGTTKADVGLSNVGNFKAVSTVASQGLTDTEKANAKANLGISDASSMGVDTSITASASNNKVPTSKAIKDYVDTEIENLPEPMIFKGSVGTGGTITSLPTASKANMGFTYKVITAGTYASQAAKVGDTFISTGTAWELIPSGDEPSGTVTSVGVSVPTGLSVSGTPVTTSGTIAISMASGYSIPTTAKQEAWDGKSVVAKSDTNGSIKINGTDTVVYTHPTGTNPHGTTKSDVGLGNVGNFKAVSTVASQGLTDTEKSNARANIGAGTGNGTYSKPSGGIPATDLASAVQTSLGKADTALQSHQSLADYVKTTDSRLTDARASNDVQAYAKTGSGITVAKSVPSDAKFTDTTYSTATTSANGLMSSSDKTKLNGIATGATAVSESTVSGWGFTKNGGTVTSVKVGTTSYSPSSGVVSLPAYPTSLPASNTTNSYSATGTVPVSGTAVAAAIGGLDVTGTTAFGAGKTISAWSETDGKISITSQNISITKSQVSDFPTSMTPTAHNQASSTITAMTGYSKASAASAIAATDSLNTAVGKLEKALDGKAASSHNQASNTITAMTGYSKASSASAISTSDSLNTAVGKLEKKVDDKVQKTSVSSANKTTSTIAIDDNSLMAMVAKISGKTVKDGTTLKSAAVESVVSSDYKYDNTILWGKGIYTDGTIFDAPARAVTNMITHLPNIIDIDIKNSSGKTIEIAYHEYKGSSFTSSGWSTNTRYTISSGATGFRLLFKFSDNSNVTSGSFSIKIYGNKTTVLVPQSIRNLPDYGVENNVVDFENGTYTHNNTISNGAVTAYTGTDKVIPISDYLRPLPVESGGTITLVNEHNLDMNSTIKYKKEV